MSRFMVRCGVTLAVMVSSVSACFSYVPADLDTIPPGESVRVFVSRAMMLDLEEVTPLSQPEVRGTVIRRENEELFIRIPIAVRQAGFHSAPIGQDVRIPLREIQHVERRQPDRLGTGALVAGTLGAAATVVFVIMKAWGEEEEDFECPDCVELMAPIFSIPIR